MKAIDIFNIIVGASSIISMIVSIMALRKANKISKTIKTNKSHKGDIQFKAKGKENFQTSGDMTINKGKNEGSIN
ncbi:hypothetical protein [Larkinella soli]|uniref:hypothetical protein n=1 Tax=Larkinella soli TaxID=1770527 RepID=UPI000FFC27E8|nr:hypothetical protein [Larkinella soli]